MLKRSRKIAELVPLARGGTYLIVAIIPMPRWTVNPAGPWGVTTPSGHFSPFAETISPLREENIISRTALSVMYDRSHARWYIEPLKCTRESTARQNNEQTTLGILR